MSAALLFIVALLYAAAAADRLLSADYPLALVFAAFAASNAGLIWALQKGTP